jgi:manganese/zinc/iron transport system ATP- binding protein
MVNTVDQAFAPTEAPSVRIMASANHAAVTRDAAIALEHITAGYGRTYAVHDVTFTIPAGSRVALVGPNGAGKSTLFRAIVGLITPSHGRVLINGQTNRQARRYAAYVPQFEDVDWEFPVSVIDVVLMGLARQIGWLRLANNSHRQLALNALARVGLRDYAHRQIGELSGGQKRRVFIARALAQGADILLLDEPFSGVDALAQQTLFEILDTLRDDGVTVLLATHDLSLVSTHFDALLVLNKTKIAYGTPEAVFKPEIMAKAFGGQMAIWHDDGQVVMLTDQHS